MNYAGFGWRFLAYLIDVFLFIVVAGILGFVLGVSLLMPINDPASPLQPHLAIRLLGLIVGWLYFAGFESSSWQATPGKRVLGVYVTDMNGNRISFGQASGRYFSKILSTLILCIGYIMIAFTEKKQGLHDIIAKTLVMKRAA